MADLDHTLESRSAQENSPLIVNLIVSEIFVAAPKGIGSLANSVILREYEPSILLQGEWVREMGFEKGQAIKVIAKHNVLRVEPAKVAASTGGTLRDDEYEVEISSFYYVKEEIDVIKAEYDDKNSGEGVDRNGDAQGSDNGCRNVTTSESESRRSKGSKNGNESGDQNGSKSDDKGEVLAEVSGELDHD